jgi:beta-galactosidase
MNPTAAPPKWLIDKHPEICPVDYKGNAHNPSLSLDYRRFASDSVISFYKLQANIINTKAPGKLITHNFMGGLTDIDYFKLGRELDIVSLGIYPNATHAEKISPVNSAVQLDAVRGIKNRNYWILEQQSGTPGGAVMYRTPKPGELRKWTYQSIGKYL